MVFVQIGCYRLQANQAAVQVTIRNVHPTFFIEINNNFNNNVIGQGAKIITINKGQNGFFLTGNPGPKSDTDSYTRTLSTL